MAKVSKKKDNKMINTGKRKHEQKFFPITPSLLKHLKDNGVPFSETELESILHLTESYFQEIDPNRPKFIVTASSHDEHLKEFMATHEVEVGAMTRKKWVGIQQVTKAAATLPIDDLLKIIQFLSNNGEEIEEIGLDMPTSGMRQTELVDELESLAQVVAAFKEVEEDEVEYQKLNVSDLSEFLDKKLEMRTNESVEEPETAETT